MTDSLQVFFDDFYSSAGGEVDECSILLRFLGEDLEPDTVTALLGIPPTQSGRKGDLTPNRLRNESTGIWVLVCERTTDSADQQIGLLLDVDLPQDISIWQSLSQCCSATMKVSLFIARWTRGATLSQTTLQKLADRGLNLQVEIYAKRPPGK